MLAIGAMLQRPASRMAQSLPYFLRHLVLSLALGACTSALVFLVWFPSPFRELSGGLNLFFLILMVDVVCGPVLTLLLLHPSKSRVALMVDISLIAMVQLSALAYGLHTLSYSRPQALVFEVDRFRVVSYADIPEVEQAHVPVWVRPWSLERPRVLGTRNARSGEEKLTSVDASLQGVEPSQRPSWWQDYALSVPRVLGRAQSLQALQRLHPGQIHAIQMGAADASALPAAGETSSPNALLWLPLVGRQASDWVVLLDPVTARIRGYLPLDGFGT